MHFIRSKEFWTRVMTSLGLVSLLALGILDSSGLLLASLFLGALLTLLCAEWPALMAPHSRTLIALLTPVYPIIPFVTLIHLVWRYLATDPILALYPLALAWTADTCGYLVGKTIGSHKICPSISPGKSWEGLVGSMLGVLALHLYALPHSPLLSHHSWLAEPIWQLAWALLFSGVGFLGGVFASIIKRRAGLKDSGTLLPGHGGILDRFDSVLFVSPLLWLLLLVLGH